MDVISYIYFDVKLFKNDIVVPWLYPFFFVWENIDDQKFNTFEGENDQ